MPVKLTIIERRPNTSVNWCGNADNAAEYSLSALPSFLDVVDEVSTDGLTLTKVMLFSDDYKHKDLSNMSPEFIAAREKVVAYREANNITSESTIEQI
jgi:hypothetical protein